MDSQKTKQAQPKI